MQLLLLLPYKLLARRFGTTHNYFVIVIVDFGVQKSFVPWVALPSFVWGSRT
jgi:hypothetical protein